MHRPSITAFLKEKKKKKKREEEEQQEEEDPELSTNPKPT